MTRQLILIAVAVLSCIASVTAWRCYSCSGASCVTAGADTQKDCGASETNCYRIIGTAGGAATATRGCGKVPSADGGDGLGANECKDTSVQQISTKICNCNNMELCNTAGRNKISFLAAGISVMMAVVLAKMA